MEVGEEGTGITSLIYNKYASLDAQMFSIFIAENDVIKPTIQFGGYQKELIYDHQSNPIRWAAARRPTRFNFEWSVAIERLELDEIKNGIIAQRSSSSNQMIKLGSSSQAVISLSTTAIVLPAASLSQIIQVFQDVHGLDCAVSKVYQSFVVCKNLQQDFKFE